MGKLTLPAAPAMNQMRIESFLGADLSNAPSNVALGRSPECPNMIRETRGKVRKRTGYHTVKTYPGRINGVHFFVDGGVKKKLVHAGTKIYLDGGTGNSAQDAVLYSAAADGRSMARQMDGKLCIFDGKKALVFQKNGSGYAIVPLESIAYTPVILIARGPAGGGTLLEPVNLLNPRREERFLGTETDKVYQLSASGLDSAAVTVKKLNASGGLDTLTEGSQFTVDRGKGTVTFTAAPGKSPIDGQDNVYITYHKTVAGYSDKINRCTIVTAYGVGGSRDRLFVAGNPDYPNQDYHSELDDPTYFGDTWYSSIGQDNSAIMGYSIVNDQLAAHKARADDGTNIILRRGALVNGQAVFSLSGSYQGTGAVSKYAFGVLETEPLYPVRGDIMAVTPSDVLGERYAQSRAYYLRGKLQEMDLSEAVAVTIGQFYYLAAGEYVFILDGSQAYYEKNAPYSTRQYEGYYWTGIHARVLWDEDGRLMFGAGDGRVKEFYTDYDYGLGQNFRDDGVPVYGAWSTPEYSGRDFYSRKDFRKIAVLLGSAVATGCRIWAYYDGVKELLRDYDATARYFTYSQFAYSMMSYKTDRAPQELIEKIKIRKVRKVRFVFENGKSEPFALYSATAEFSESR